MALTVENFVVPKGKFHASLFPVGDMAEYLQGFLDEAMRETVNIPITKREKAQKAYVYWKGWEQVVVLLNSEPLRMTSDGNSASREWDKSQIERFERYAQLAAAEYDSYQITIDLTITKPKSQTIKVKPVW